MSEHRIGAITRTDFPSLTAGTPIRRAVAALLDSGSAAAPVLGDDGTLIGILTQKDCFRPALHASYHREWTGQVADHMSREVISVPVGEELTRVAKLFLQHPHRVFPVLDGTTVTGLLYRSDVLRLLTQTG